MEFKSKRKYTKFFLLAILLHSMILAYWFLFPETFLTYANEKTTIVIVATITCELILIFYIGLYRGKYYAYHDHLLIKQSLVKNKKINYKDITRIQENPNDSIVLWFGRRPSFTIYHNNKRTILRSDNNQLMLQVINNELEIAKSNNKNQ